MATQIQKMPLPKKWREFIPTTYLGLDDLIAPDGKYLTFALETDRVEAHNVENPKTHKKEPKLVLFFKKGSKGLILNATICKVLQEIAGSPDPSRWGGLSVEVYVERNVSTPKGRQDVPRLRKNNSRVGGHATAEQLAPAEDEAPIDLSEMSEEELAALMESEEVHA